MSSSDELGVGDKSGEQAILGKIYVDTITGFKGGAETE